ncbi:sensor histidine kinase [Rubrivirga sp.]|uniref:sensor histidine kinase n=1 Tax=Rubrivirga sp. TaxID=1885344 RepID=UPI003B51E012
MTTPPLPTRRPWPSRAELAWIVGFWATLGVLSVLREALEPWEDDPIRLGQVVERLAEFGLWSLVTPVVFWLVGRPPAERGTRAGRLVAQVGVSVVAAVAVEWVTRGALRPLFGGPPDPDRVWTLAGAVGRLWFLDELLIALAILAAGYARAALFQVQERRAEAERLLADRVRLEAQLTEARLSALRMQLNPHFLFNTLNAVSALVERDPAGVRTMIARLSSLLRRVLDDDGATEVPLRDELAFLRDYLDVQRVRFQGGLDVDEAIGPDVLDALVPPLVLQPLVENAVGHGVRRIEGGVGHVRLSARREGDRLVLAVEDNGPGLAGGDGAGGSGGVGLKNTRARLDALYGDAGTLSVRDRVGGGVVAEVALPYRLAPSDASLSALADA